MAILVGRDAELAALGALARRTHLDAGLASGDTGAGAGPGEPYLTAALTERERDVLRLLAHGAVQP